MQMGRWAGGCGEAIECGDKRTEEREIKKRETNWSVASLQLRISCEPWLRKMALRCRLGSPNWHRAKREGVEISEKQRHIFGAPREVQQEVDERQLGGVR